VIVVLALVALVVVAVGLTIAFRSPTRGAGHSIDRYGTAMRALSELTTAERDGQPRGSRAPSILGVDHDGDRDPSVDPAPERGRDPHGDPDRAPDGTADGGSGGENGVSRRAATPLVDPSSWVPRAPASRTPGSVVSGGVARGSVGQAAARPARSSGRIRPIEGLRPTPVSPPGGHSGRPGPGLGAPGATTRSGPGAAEHPGGLLDPPGRLLDPSAATPELPPLAREAARIIGVWEPPGGRDPSVEANARLTGTTGLVLAVLFFAEGLTIPFITRLVSWHIAIGLALIPPILVKMSSTLWKFSRYYLGDPRFRRAGPPHPFLRMLGPLVMLSTVVLMVSGVALWLGGPQDHTLFRIHQLTFVAWFVFIALHVIAHFLRAVRLAASDSRDAHGERKVRRPARVRRSLVVASLLVGLGFGLVGREVSSVWTRPVATTHVSPGTSATHPRP